MGIRALCAAAAVVVAVGQAEAATVYEMKASLRYEGTYYTEGHAVFYSENGPDDELSFSFSNYLADGNNYGIPVLDSNLSIGDSATFAARFSVPADQSQVLGYYDNGGRSDYCFIAGIACGYISQVFMDDYIDFAIDGSNYSSLYSSLIKGGELRYTFNLGYASTLYIDGGRVDFYNRTAIFTLLDDAMIAPVPLPPAVALMPMGLGALALLRRRRRVVS